MLFLSKTTSVLKNKTNSEPNNNENAGLIYSNAIIGDLVNKDTDLDGILDWEESLWGTDPTKRETTSGIGDGVAIEKLKEQQNIATGTSNSNGTTLTQTDKFSQELFATVAALDQNGAMNQTTVDTLSSSLSEQIQNSAPRKIFLFSDIKIINNETTQTKQNYGMALGSTFTKHTLNVSIPDILAESLTSDGDIDVAVLNKLDPVIKHIKGIVDEMTVMSVPSSIAILHLEALNDFERIMENLIDIKLVEKDTIVAMGAISQYQENDEKLKTSIEKLISALN